MPNTIMNLIKNKKFWFILLLTAIIIINFFTIIKIFSFFSINNDIFSTPDHINISNGNKAITIYPDNENFNNIIKLNSKRGEPIEYFTELECEDPAELKETYIEYVFNDNIKINIPFLLEQTSLKVKKVSFILTGKYSTRVYIEAEEKIISLGELNTNTELIDTVKNLLNN